MVEKLKKFPKIGWNHEASTDEQVIQVCRLLFEMVMPKVEEVIDEVEGLKKYKHSHDFSNGYIHADDLVDAAPSDQEPKIYEGWVCDLNKDNDIICDSLLQDICRVKGTAKKQNCRPIKLQEVK